MKSIFLFLAIALMATTSCKKDNPEIVGDVDNMVGTYQGTLFIDNPEVIIHDTFEWTVTKVNNRLVRIQGEHIGIFETEVSAHPSIGTRLDSPLSYQADPKKFTWYFEGDNRYMWFVTNDTNISFYGEKMN